MQKQVWLIPLVAVGSLFLGGCLQPEQTTGPQKNDLSYGALSGLNWTQLPGTGKEIAVSSSGRIWKINAGSGDQKVQYWDPSTSAWIQPSIGSGVRIEVENGGSVWAVNSLGDAWKADVNGNNWVKYNTQDPSGTITIRDIGAGGNNQVWAVGGSYDATYGYEVFNLVNGKWWSSAARAMRVTVDKNGAPWVINLQSDVFQLTGGNWVKRGTIKAYGIGAGPDGQVWISGPIPSSRIYKWTGSTWDLCDNGLATEIDRGNGFTIAINSANQIWKGTP